MEVDAESDAAELGGLRAGTAAPSAVSLPQNPSLEDRLKDLPVESTNLGTKEETWSPDGCVKRCIRFREISQVRMTRQRRERQVALHRRE